MGPLIGASVYVSEYVGIVTLMFHVYGTPIIVTILLLPPPKVMFCLFVC